MTKRIPAIIVGGLLTVGVLASPASARGTDVIHRGQCSATSTWKLKAGPDNGQLEVEFEVDSNRAGQNWAVKLVDNGTQIFSGTRTTQAPSGSFTVRKLTANRAGADNIVGTARNTANGETCRGTVTV
jgi:hypothetical protein